MRSLFVLAAVIAGIHVAPRYAWVSMPDFSDATGTPMTEFNSFTQRIGDTLPILEAMGYEVVMFNVTWGLPPEARLRLTDIGAVTAIAAKAPLGQPERQGCATRTPSRRLSML
jgi:hypothetical protein